MNKLKIVGILLLLFGLGVILTKCNKDPIVDSPKLSDTDRAKVIVDHNKLIVTTRDTNGNDKTTVKFIPEHGTVVFKKNGDVEIQVKQLGLQLEPGIGVIGFSNGMAVSVDIQIAYWRRMGLNLGTGIQGVKSYKPFIAMSYRLPWDFVSNTSTILGYDPFHKEIVAGLRLKF